MIVSLAQKRKEGGGDEKKKAYDGNAFKQEIHAQTTPFTKFKTTYRSRVGVVTKGREGECKCTCEFQDTEVSTPYLWWNVINLSIFSLCVNCVM